MKQLFVYLSADDTALNFTEQHFSPFTDEFPETELIFLDDEEALLSVLPQVKWLDTWYFDKSWYESAPNLKAVFTPAAGKDWVHEDPRGLVPVHYGKFHGPMIAQSMLGLMLHFNRSMGIMIDRQRNRVWDRNAQRDSKLLSNQTALIIGYGNIGKTCGNVLTGLGMQVFGHQRQYSSGVDVDTAVQYIHQDDLQTGLKLADHVIVLLPGGEKTRHFITLAHLNQMQPSAYIYNFGRGSTINETDLLSALDTDVIAGAGLDVTEEEPLPQDSRLWTHEKIVLLPHSSCVYTEYQQLHIQELINLLNSG